MALANVTFLNVSPEGTGKEEKKQIRWERRALEEMKSDLLRKE